MKDKLTVNVNEFLKIYEQIEQINARKLSEIELIFDGEIVDITQKDIDNWQFIGLNTADYIRNRNFSKEIK